MAQYNISTGPLYEAGEYFGLAADELEAARERLAAVLAGWQGQAPDDIRRRLAAAGSAVSEASLSTRDMGRVVKEISEIYANAERRAASGQSHFAHAGMAAPKQASAPVIRKPSGVIFTGESILPEWLRKAALRYEQSGPGIG